MAKMVQALSDLNETFFDCEPSVRFDLAVKKFCGSSLAQSGGV
jgi:adenosine/AMP kinase